MKSDEVRACADEAITFLVLLPSATRGQGGKGERRRRTITFHSAPHNDTLTLIKQSDAA